MERWGGVNYPLVKTVAGLAVSLFLALNFPVALLVIMAGVLLYALTLLGVIGAYRKRYRIVGMPELAVRFAAKILERLKEEYDRTVVRGLQERERRKRIRQEEEERLRRYQRERNRRKREHTRRAFSEYQPSVSVGASLRAVNPAPVVGRGEKSRGQVEEQKYF